MPADFLLLSGVDICAERGGEELAAEADAENGLGALQSVFDQAHFVRNQGNLSCSYTLCGPPMTINPADRRFPRGRGLLTANGRRFDQPACFRASANASRPLDLHGA